MSLHRQCTERLPPIRKTVGLTHCAKVSIPGLPVAGGGRPQRPRRTSWARSQHRALGGPHRDGSQRTRQRSARWRRLSEAWRCSSELRSSRSWARVPPSSARTRHASRAPGPGMVGRSTPAPGGLARMAGGGVSSLRLRPVSTALPRVSPLRPPMTIPRPASRGARRGSPSMRRAGRRRARPR